MITSTPIILKVEMKSRDERQTLRCLIKIMDKKAIYVYSDSRITKMSFMKMKSDKKMVSLERNILTEYFPDKTAKEILEIQMKVIKDTEYEIKHPKRDEKGKLFGIGNIKSIVYEIINPND